MGDVKLIITDEFSKEIKNIRKHIRRLKGETNKDRFLEEGYSLQICALEAMQKRLLRAIKKETVRRQTKTVSESC